MNLVNRKVKKEQPSQWGLSQSNLSLFSIGLITTYLVIVLHRAWVCDDSYITFRVVDNFILGYGLRWNVFERVQVFTHPLWLLTLLPLHAITKEIYLTSIFLSVVLSGLTCLLLFGMEKKNPALPLGFILLACSSAFVDYSTSGLENPLSHFLLAVFLFFYWKILSHNEVNTHFLFWAGCTAGLGCLNRLDYLLLYLPAIAYLAIRFRGRKNAVAILLSGFVPLLLWLVFATIYYGFPLPNTFYAKLNHWVPQQELIRQGLRYFLHTLKNDPVTGITMIAGLTMAFIHRSWERAALTFGLFLYGCYTVWIGGDFMEGRFYTGIFLICAAQLVHYDLHYLRKGILLLLFVILVILNCMATVPTIAPASWEFVETWEDGIVNERQFYAATTSLFRDHQFNKEPNHNWVADGKRLKTQCEAEKDCVATLSSVGFAGYYAGPDVSIIDTLGLGSALLARIPPRYTVEWRIGHFERDVPAGYLSQFTSEGKGIQDPSLAEYESKLAVLSEGDLFSPERFRLMWKFWRGEFDYLIQ